MTNRTRSFGRQGRPLPPEARLKLLERELPLFVVKRQRGLSPRTRLHPDFVHAVYLPDNPPHVNPACFGLFGSWMYERSSSM